MAGATQRRAADDVPNVARRSPPGDVLRLLPQRLERRAQLRSEECRFFPGGEVATLIDLVEVGKAGVDRLGPAARSSPYLTGERREADRNLDRRRGLTARKLCGQSPCVLPVRPCCRRHARGLP